MKRAESHNDGEMRMQYDFSTAVKNPYVERFARGSNIVMIKPEIFAAFPSEKAVNDALELLMRTNKLFTARTARRRTDLRIPQGVGSR